MKNLKFGNLNLDSIQTLSRNEAKKIIGGYGNSGGGGGGDTCESKECAYSWLDSNNVMHTTYHSCSVTGTPASKNCMWVCSKAGAGSCF